MDSATIVDASTAQQASFAFSTTQSFAILAHSIPTHPTRLNTTFANCRWKSYHLSCRAVTVKSHSARWFSREGWRLPRFYPSRDYLVPLHEYPRALRHGLSA